MLRKKGCVPSALTQNVKDLLASREIEAILDKTDFMILLSQAQSDRAILAKQLGISEHPLSYIDVYKRQGLRSLPRHSVDMLLTDPPYGTTRNFWDVPLPLPELWEAVKRCV